ncbi:hypothetical protein LOKVESSMR4R_01793 [Yoonia vestfoldensis]|uniref:Uncharacterized protein n=1 Tax=Yoonia vestfoldensis TaxID=245188 RepID=A0A1Y0EBX5_9RHOB|nr:hypothetical protein LOKVESSMR4R_01793 [Yoonia vestfoldensis]
MANEHLRCNTDDYANNVQYLRVWWLGNNYDKYHNLHTVFTVMSVHTHCNEIW